MEKEEEEEEAAADAELTDGLALDAFGDAADEPLGTLEAHLVFDERLEGGCDEVVGGKVVLSPASIELELESRETVK